MIQGRYELFTEVPKASSSVPAFEIAPADWTDAWAMAGKQLIGWCPIIVGGLAGERLHVKATIRFALDINVPTDTVQARIRVDDNSGTALFSTVGIMGSSFVHPDGKLATIDMAGEFTIPGDITTGQVRIGIQFRNSGTLLVSQPANDGPGWVDYTVIKL